VAKRALDEACTMPKNVPPDTLSKTKCHLSKMIEASAVMRTHAKTESLKVFL